jgi:hypothetical protein
MNPRKLPKIQAATADICRPIPLSAESRQLLRDGLTPGEYFDLLVEKKQYVAAVDLVAYGLPKREAVWWACLCVRTAYGSAIPAPQAAALKGAVQWVLDPSEENRLAAQAPGEGAGYNTAAGCAAMAAFGADGSLNPPNLPAVPPNPLMTAQAVSGAVLLAAAQGDPANVLANQRRFAELGADIASGKHLWPATTK